MRAAGRAVVGRADLVAAVGAHLADGGGVVLTGPGGIGKSTVLDVVAAAYPGPVVRAAGAEADRWVDGGVLADLLAAVPDDVVEGLPDAQRETVLKRAGDPVALRAAWRAVLVAMEPLVVLDDVQWIDAVSAEVHAHAVRVFGATLAVVVAGRDEPAQVGLLVPRPVLRVAVPPLQAGDIAELVAEYGLSAREAQALHADAAGNPALALALAAEGQAVAPPSAGAARVRAGLAMLSPQARKTLLLCALASAPTTRLLLRAGRADARQELAEAVAAGLVFLDADTIRFTPPGAATVVADLATAEDRARAHRVLADAVVFPDQRERHLALASDRPDARVARTLVTAADGALRRGARDLAAELFMLAADRTPVDQAATRQRWLVAAAQAGAGAGLEELTRRAVDAVLSADSLPLDRVRVRMALAHLEGQRVGDIPEVFAAAAVDAGSDPAALAVLHLWRAWSAVITAHPASAVAEAEQAVAHATATGDWATAALGHAVIALMYRLMGRADHNEPLAAAFALPPAHLDGSAHLSPRFVHARFALLDDRTADAHAELLALLAVVERGTAEEHVSVLRALVEVTVVMGRCADALDYAARAARVGGSARLSPGPGWYACALAELAGGSIARAREYAERGVAASEQEQDNVFLRRHLYALGQAHLRAGDPAGAVDVLRRIPELEGPRSIADPSNLRWHGDLAAALVATGELDAARALLDQTRAALVDKPHGLGVTARLDRAEAAWHSARGDHAAAVDLLDRAVGRFTDLGHPIEAGHALVVRAQVERRARRLAAARRAVDDAVRLFTGARARPWLAHADHLRARLDGHERARPAELTATERRIADLAADGATNREIAAGLYLSVKTVEATLTRVYRKLDVRSRTQLARALRRP
ncbi:LuxR family transcriptional regulator [Actinokineospora fastidiosa]|uniref:LuxR C-terminal-related transcriptional regulator n=1 Tax=Actinokineospora fastidiosa TaxID=1816 RepID=UPI00227D9578|nr:LuxR family transcriptional regulator [Actinokineospora fastidiosa]